ncbi:MAG: hypothetical protein LBL98_02055 [Ruminococcus sp.]|nr:hypothetical protein [Ruminococcus sp.]
MREDEFSHKGIDKAAQINKTIIKSNEYRRKFDNATDNPKVNKTLYDSAKEILFDRSGTRFETMYWIDGDTGEIITKFEKMGNTPELSGEDNELKVLYPDSVLHKLTGHNNVIVIHNHPNSTAPSAGDFNSAYLHGYSLGFVVTHDGRVFKYKSFNRIENSTYQAYWEEFIGSGLEEVDAQLSTIEKFESNLDIICKEVFRNDLDRR